MYEFDADRRRLHSGLGFFSYPSLLCGLIDNILMNFIYNFRYRLLYYNCTDLFDLDRRSIPCDWTDNISMNFMYIFVWIFIFFYLYMIYIIFVSSLYTFDLDRRSVPVRFNNKDMLGSNCQSVMKQFKLQIISLSLVLCCTNDSILMDCIFFRLFYQFMLFLLIFGCLIYDISWYNKNNVLCKWV